MMLQNTGNYFQIHSNVDIMINTRPKYFFTNTCLRHKRLFNVNCVDILFFAAALVGINNSAALHNSSVLKELYADLEHAALGAIYTDTQQSQESA